MRTNASPFELTINNPIFMIQIAHATMRKLVEVKGISEQKAQKLREIIKSHQLVSVGFQTATNKLECMKDLIMLSTGEP